MHDQGPVLLDILRVDNPPRNESLKEADGLFYVEAEGVCRLPIPSLKSGEFHALKQKIFESGVAEETPAVSLLGSSW